MRADDDFLPHDLLWGLTPAQLPDDAPAWVSEALSLGQPVVVRRALTAAEQLPVGIRGALREQRFATLMPRALVERRVSPEALIDIEIGVQGWPALQALHYLRPLLNASGLAWGVSGSAGFELATGLPTLHQYSDLDLILRAPQALPRRQAAGLLRQLDNPFCRVDLQVQTPHGAVALAEWAGTARRVLLKRAEGALLVLDPWTVQEWAA
ncbi:malonate decarboxylase holo-ACP synthase [Pseudomonas gingeri]|uniref:Phosphoribosyl-dephospho-CoA transferase n=1 Tax=Pseudomonas gingeri TaxID=117681 RepID=A0A7Y7YEJ7_9PSED|nr:malonate decarboxylase holo-ACP synthase [Pseudomonas gingeri]NWA01096.1 malonate decarboxylase holo-ACP synthase [Pseudomonas gingeri]NWA15339.1 malonate decarboxylase holo-ACP synthase [Pseudomonas gingeri]NWA53546.1 malonate decarboxylase holo-ACP synthase [Pseudomonas gingeri]NWA99193.1 malonate decarboxylase holo-ACP synthase [Pseudomonas gingeri]NWB03949.1 malonate decarboxylase holo-ACP synthase [Pseudomonas gingeri]